MIKSFSGQVVFCFAIPEPYLLKLNKLDDSVINSDSVNSFRNRLSTSHFD